MLVKVSCHKILKNSAAAHGLIELLKSTWRNRDCFEYGKYASRASCESHCELQITFLSQIKFIFGTIVH